MFALHVPYCISAAGNKKNARIDLEIVIGSYLNARKRRMYDLWLFSV